MAKEVKRPDPQMQRVYDMEATAFYAWSLHVTSIARLRRMAARVCEHYDLPTVTLELLSARSTDRGSYENTDGSIALCPYQGRTALVLAHELAHHLVDQRFPQAADHGPTFVKFYAEILAFLGVMPVQSFRAAARLHKVRIA